MYSIGIDIGGSHITCGMYDHQAKKLLRETLNYRKVDTRTSKDEILEIWTTAILETINLARVPFLGIGIAMPGPFDYFEGISQIAEVDKLCSLYGVNIRQELSARLGVDQPRIRFINDASAFSIAEALVGRASAYKRTVAITLGTGFGSSFLIEAQPVIEAYNVPIGGFLYNQPYQDKLADDIFSTRGLISRYTELSGKKVKNVQELNNLVPKDEDAKLVFQWFGTELGIFIKPYLDTFNAEIVVIGGNISKAYSHFGDYLINQLPEYEIYVSNFGEEAAIIGSALLLDDQFYSDLRPTLKLM